MSTGSPAPSDSALSETIRLLHLAKDGDRQALEHLYGRYGERLRVAVRFRLGRRLRSKMESCDIVQETLMASLRSVEGADFATEGAFFHWLTKLAENRIRDLADRFSAQRRDAARESPIEGGNAATGSVFGPIADLAASGTPSQAAIRAEDTARLEAAIDALPDDQREALLLVRYEGLSLAEAGAIVGRSPDAVRMLTARAMVRLGKELGAAEP